MLRVGRSAHWSLALVSLTMASLPLLIKRQYLYGSIHTLRLHTYRSRVLFATVALFPDNFAYQFKD
jgi:hypothetical protein